jgi:outer membrane protein TolC
MIDKKRRIKSLISVILILTLTSTVFAATTPIAPYKLPTSSEKTVQTALKLSVDQAVAYGLEHNLTLKGLENKIDLAEVTYHLTDTSKGQVENSSNLLKDARSELARKTAQLDKAQADLNQANALLAAGVTPVAVPLVDGGGNPIKDGQDKQIVLPIGTAIQPALEALGLPAEMVAALKAGITATIQAGLNENQTTIDQNRIALTEASKTLGVKSESFDEALKDTSAKLEVKLNSSSNLTFSSEEASKLMITMAGVNLNVTRYAREIYRKQIAMLIQKNYYDALYAKNLVDLKEKSNQRGLAQYSLISLSYENGMKSKDDMLLSKMYCTGTQVALRMAQTTYNKALYELKKNLNLDQTCALTLIEPDFKVVQTEDLDTALKSGLSNRIEIQQSLGQLAIYQVNQSILEKRYGTKFKYDPKVEADLLLEAAKIDLEEKQSTVKNEIYQSYENLLTAQELVVMTSDLVADAKMVLDIAQLKYEQGFGADNALMTKLDLGSSSGTVIELLAAEENLCDVEAQVAKARYSYVMARIKFKNDAALLN